MRLDRRALSAVVTTAVGLGLVPAALIAAAPPASAAVPDIRITEWEYNGSEFVELTNLGTSPVDFTGWSFDDSTRTADSTSLSGFGLVASNESVILSEVSAAAFRTEWALPGTVKVIGGNLQNLSRSDEINIYDATDALVDRLTYDDQGTGNVKGPRTDTASAWVTTAALGANNASAWVRSTLGDAESSVTSVGGFIGSPGTTTQHAPDTGSPDDVVINEVRSNPNPDLVELLNTGTVPVDITGWKVIDNDGTHTPATITTGPTTIAAGGFFTFDPNALTGGFGLGSGDSVTILLPDDTTAVDSFDWAFLGAHATPSYGRCPDGTGDLVQNATSTPGATNDCPAAGTPDVRLNEVESNGDTVGDWVEITNAGDAPADVSGWKVVDSDGSHPFAVVPAGTTLEPGAFYALYTEFPPPGFGLGTDDTVHLYQADGTTQVDEFGWTGGHAATTFGRCPDGTGAWQVTTVATRGTANACSPIRLNEISSDPTDWVELVNLSGADIDVAGWVIKDSGDTAPTTLPSPSVVPAHGHLLVDALAAGLGSSDSARLFDPSAALIDSYSWTAHGVPTYGRCADGVGAFKQTGQATPGAPNECPGLDLQPWPGSQTVDTSDVDTTFTADASGLVFDPADPTTLWVAANKAGTLFKLTKDGATWVPASGWPTGRDVHYADGTGNPDTEGITIGPDGALYLTSERNNAVSGVSKNTLLRYEPEVSTNATDEWDLGGLLTGLGANLGLEGMTFVPDAALVAGGFVDESTTAAYDPADYPQHGSGLFVVAVEGTGLLYALALDHTAAVQEQVHLVATIDPQLLTNAGPPSVMDVTWDPEYGVLRALCDDSCDGASVDLDINASGAFEVVAAYNRPVGMPNLNNEGRAFAPQSTCVDGAKEVVWADDGDTDGHSLRSGTFPCTELPTAKVPATVTGTDVQVAYGRGTSMAVTVTADGVTPTGRVVLRAGDVVLGAGELVDGAATAKIAPAKVPPGTHEVTISYTGDDSVERGTDTATLTVTKATPRVIGTWTSVEYGQGTVMPVRVGAAGVVATGEVTLSVGDVELGTGELTSGTTAATIGAGLLLPGRHEVTISYPGDDFVSEGQATAVLLVRRATPTVTGTDVEVAFDHRTTMPVTVTAGGGLVPSGRVVLKVGDVVLGTGTLTDGATSATIAAGRVPVGTHEVTVTYTGDDLVARGTTTAELVVTP